MIFICLFALSLAVCYGRSISSKPNNYVNVIKVLDRNLPYASTWDLQLDLMQHHLEMQDKPASTLEVSSEGFAL
jgi:hypothetical protein